MNFLEYRIRLVLNMRKEKNFYFALLLGLKFITMSATIITYGYITTASELTWSGGYLYDMTSFIWVGSVIGMFLFLGKEIIYIHIKAFDWIDNQFRKLIDWYSIRYWRKNKKDAPLLTFIQKWGYKIFGFYYKLSPKRRKMLLIMIFVCYGSYFIGVRYVNELALFIDQFV